MNPALTTTFHSLYGRIGPHGEHVRRVSGWVATAVDLYCDFSSKAQPAAITRSGPARHEAKPLPWGSDTMRLLRKPCGNAMPRDLWQRIVLRYFLATGNAYLYKQRLNGKTVALWPVPTQAITPIRHEKTGLIASLQLATQDDPIPYREFIHIRRPNLADPYGEGLSPISEHALAVELADAVDGVRLQAFKSPRRPNMMFGSELPLSDDDVQRNEARVMQKWGGTPGQEGRPMFLDSGLKLLGPVTLTPQEIDFLQTTRVTREEVICGIYRVPMILAGFTEPGQPPSEGLIAGAATLFAVTVVDPALHAVYSQIVTGIDDTPNIDASVSTTAPQNRNQDRADEAVDRRECLRSVNEIREARGLPPINDPWANSQHWRPETNARTYSSDPAPNAQPTNRGTTPPGPKPRNQDTLDDATTGDTATA